MKDSPVGLSYETVSKRFIISIVLVVTAAISTSTAAVIDFDDLIGGPIGAGELVTSQYSALGVNFFDTYYGGAQANDTLTSRMPGSSAPNILFVDQSGGLTGGQYLEIDFSHPVSDVSTLFVATGDITLSSVAVGCLADDFLLGSSAGPVLLISSVVIDRYWLRFCHLCSPDVVVTNLPGRAVRQAL